MKVATIVTGKGNIRIQLHHDKVPKTCANFEKLVGQGFYDGLTFPQIAARTKSTLGTVHSRFRYGMSKLRGLLKERT